MNDRVNPTPDHVDGRVKSPYATDDPVRQLRVSAHRGEADQVTPDESARDLVDLLVADCPAGADAP